MIKKIVTALIRTNAVCVMKINNVVEDTGPSLALIMIIIIEAMMFMAMTYYARFAVFDCVSVYYDIYSTLIHYQFCNYYDTTV